MSSRLRGKDSEDEWQSIPEEWLKDGEESGEENGLRRSKRKGREVDTTAAEEAVLNDVSDLTSLSELSDMPEMDDEEEEEEDYSEAEEEEEVKEEEESTPPLELDFSTPDKEVWETVSTLLLWFLRANNFLQGLCDDRRLGRIPEAVREFQVQDREDFL